MKIFLISILITSNIFANEISNPKIYGNATVYTNISDNSKETKIGLENEMYIGFKGESQLENTLSLGYQFESGYLGEDGAKIGNRNSFVSLSKNSHSIKAGRLTTGLYDIIDWPFSHILGNLADWSNPTPNMGMYDRNGNTVRYDYKTNTSNFSFSYGPQDSARNNFFDSSLVFQLLDFSFYMGAQLKNDVSTDGLKQRTTTSLLGVQKTYQIHTFYMAIKNVQVKNSNNSYSDEDTDGAGAISKKDDLKQNTIIAAYSFNINKFSTKLAAASKMDLYLNGNKVPHSKAQEYSLQETYSLGSKTVLFSRFIFVNNSKSTKYLSYKNGENAKRLYFGVSHDF